MGFYLNKLKVIYNSTFDEHYPQYTNNMGSKLFHLQLAIILCCCAAAVWCIPSRPSKCGISSNPDINRKPSDAVTKDEVCSKLKNESVLFIDIRQKWELKRIPPILQPEAKNFMHVSLDKFGWANNAKHFPGSASYWKCLKNEGFCPNP